MPTKAEIKLSPHQAKLALNTGYGFIGSGVGIVVAHWANLGDWLLLAGMLVLCGNSLIVCAQKQLKTAQVWPLISEHGTRTNKKYRFYVQVFNKGDKPLRLKHVGWWSSVFKARWDMRVLKATMNGIPFQVSENLDGLDAHAPQSDPLLAQNSIPPGGFAEFIIDLDALCESLSHEHNPLAVIAGLEVFVEYANGDFERISMKRQRMQDGFVRAWEQYKARVSPVA